MKLRFAPRATRDLVDIADYIHARSPAGAERVRDAILNALQGIAMFPNAGRRQSTEGVRKLVMRKYPYLIYYTADAAAGEIIVLSIRHSARKREHRDA